MKSFFDSTIGYFLAMLEPFVKKFGVKAVVIGLQITAITLYRAFQIVAIAYFIAFLFRLWTLTKDLIHDLNNFGVSVGGSLDLIKHIKLNSFYNLDNSKVMF